MKETARHTAFAVLAEMEKARAYSNIGLDRRLARSTLSARDKALTTRLVNGVIERKLTLDDAVGRYLRSPGAKIKTNVRILLRMGAYELLFCDGIPARASVNEYVALSRQIGASYAAGMINAVLRRVAENGLVLPPREDPSYLSVKYSLPPALIDCFAGVYGAQTMDFFDALSREAKVYGRVNTCKTDFAALQAALAREDVEIAAVPAVSEAFYFTHTAAFMHTAPFRDGWFHIQDLSSIAAMRLLQLQDGMRVLDVCAAPGGKSFAAAECMHGTGVVTACDIYEHKTELIRAGAARLGLGNVQAVLRDAATTDDSTLYDRIICDVPCSGLGVLRKKPELRYRDVSDLRDLCELQYAILCASAAALKPGGRLVYSTCTVTACENEEIIKRFLASHASFTPVRESLPVGAASEYGVRFSPHRDDCDGFFACALVRKEGRL